MGERIAVKQADLAREMGLSPSVLSDYESGRRASPGVGFIKRYVYALVSLDQSHQRLLQKEVEPQDRSAILAIGEFKEPVKARKLLEVVGGNIVTGAEKLETDIYGYTVLDSIKTIYALSGFDFYKIYGATTERLLVFTKVGLGRSPMVAVRVAPPEAENGRATWSKGNRSGGKGSRREGKNYSLSCGSKDRAGDNSVPFEHIAFRRSGGY